MTATCSSPFRRTPTIPPRHRPSPTPTATFLSSGSGNLFNGIRVAGKNSPYGRAIYAADTNNLQPRIGAAWDPGGAGRTDRARRLRHVLRPDAGRDVRAERAGGTLPYTDPFRTDVFVEQRPALESRRHRHGLHPKPPYVRLVTPQPVYATSDPFVAPRWQHWNIGVQRRLYSRGMIDVGLRRRREAIICFDTWISTSRSRAIRGSRSANLVRPFPGYDDIVMRETTARSRYHGFAGRAFVTRLGADGSLP